MHMDPRGYKKRDSYPEPNLQDDLRKAELMDWTMAKNSQDALIMNSYIPKCNNGYYPSSHINEAKDPIKEWESGSIVVDWDRVLTEADMDVRVATINEFIQRYAMNPSETTQRYLDKAQKEFKRLLDEKVIRKDWNDAIQTNTILGYVDFITKHPYSDYREEADQRIKNMKSDLLNDMKRFVTIRTKPT